MTGGVPAAAAPLLVITDRAAARGRPLAEVVRAAVEGGARRVQLREKDLEGAALHRLALELLAITRPAGAELLVNDRVDVALAAGADGVVLPARSLPTAAARALVGAAKVVARSTHSAEEVAAAAREGCDFALFGPVFATPSKAAWGPPLGLDALARAARASIPVYGVGGVTAASARSVIEAGAAGVAVITAVMSADEPRAAVRAILEAVSR